MNKTNKIDSSQFNISVINFLDKYDNPCSIKNNESRYIFINEAALIHYGIPLKFNYEGCLDSELPHPGSELAQKFQENDKKIIQEGKVIIEIETHIYGKDKKLQPHICEKIPFYDNDDTCIGIICMGRNFESASLYYQSVKLGSICLVTEPTVNIFTEKELDVIFLLLHGLSSKEIAKILNLSPRTVQSRTSIIYQKANINSYRQLKEYCIGMRLNKYIPKRFLYKGVHTLTR